MKPKSEIIKRTLELWQPLSEEKLKEEDAREIIENVAGFFTTLKRWDDEKRRKQENERDCSLRDSDNPNQT